jgi:alkylation response protein AidB-like acyl-CoA dehydrogenase
MRRNLYDADHEAFRESFGKFLEAEVVPHREEWARHGIVPRELFTAAGRSGSWAWTCPRSTAAGAWPTSGSTR